MQHLKIALDLTVFFIVHRIVSSNDMITPYEMKTEFFDKSDGPTCGKHEFRKVIGLSGYIYSHDPKMPTYRSHIQCFLSIEVPTGHQISLEALEFNLGYPTNSAKCQSDSLFIFDNQPENGKIFDSDPNMLGEFCGIDNRTVLATSSKNSITLYWHAGSPDKRYPNAKGFVLKWTVLRKVPEAQRSGIDGGCDIATEFLCSTQQTCIPLELACDSVAHCGDGSDLIKSRQINAGCDNIESDSVFADLSGAAIAGIIIACILISVLTMVIFICCCISSRRRSRQSTSSRNNLNYQPAPTTAPSGVVISSSNGCTPIPTQLSSSSNNSYNHNKNHIFNNIPNYNNHYHPQHCNNAGGIFYNTNHHGQPQQHQQHIMPNDIV